MSVLGIDLGTTSVKVTLYDEEQQQVVATSAQPANAYIESEYREQDVNLIWLALDTLLTSLGVEKLRNVKCVAVSCQMHGVVLWRRKVSTDAPLETSHLITWEDQRCDAAFLESLPKSRFQKISTGYGCASLFWLSKHRKEYLASWDFAGTVGDLLVVRLCGLDRSPMSPHNAAFWGYFDVAGGKWEDDVLTRANFPTRLLPPVVPEGHVVGHVTDSWTPLPAGPAVSVAIGDLQASFLAATWRQSAAAVVNVGTSSQLIFPLTAGRPSSQLPPSLVLVPYFGASLAVAASLNGGNVLAHFVAMLRSWLCDLGLEEPAAAQKGASDSPDEPLWDRLTAAAAAAAAAATEAEAEAPEIRATLFGERHDEAGCAAVLGIRPGPGLRVGAVFRALCDGVMRNLREMGAQVLADHVTRVIGTGSALRRNSALRQAFLHTFTDLQPAILDRDVDASLGAALSVVCS